MKETELAEKFIDHFGENADVYCEVPINGGTCDIVVKQYPVIIAIEVKTTLSMDVLEQAMNKIGYANYVYIAVPYGKGRDFVRRFCNDKGIGILYYHKEYKQVREFVRPRLFRRIVKPKLEDWQKKNTAGSQSIRMTAFKNFVNDVYEYLSTKDGRTYQQVFDNVIKYYHTLSSFKSNIYQYVRRGVIKHVTIENGKLYLDAEGFKEYQKQMREQFGHFYNR